MGLIDNIKRIIQGLKKNKETDFSPEEEQTLIEEEQSEDESIEDEDQSEGDR
jgi:hypothetical protein